MLTLDSQRRGQVQLRRWEKRSSWTVTVFFLFSQITSPKILSSLFFSGFIIQWQLCFFAPALPTRKALSTSFYGSRIYFCCRHQLLLPLVHKDFVTVDFSDLVVCPIITKTTVATADSVRQFHYNCTTGPQRYCQILYVRVSWSKVKKKIEKKTIPSNPSIFVSTIQSQQRTI